MSKGTNIQYIYTHLRFDEVVLPRPSTEKFREWERLNVRVPISLSVLTEEHVS